MEWFLIQQNEHSGPYTKDTVLKFYKEKKINSQTLLWKEGWEEARTYSDIFFDKSQVDDFTLNEIEENESIVEDSELPPDLPPLPFEDEINGSVTEDLENSDIEDNIEIEEQSDEESSVAQDCEVESLEEVETESVEEIEASNFLTYVKYLAISFILIAIAVPAGMYFQAKNDVFSRPERMSVKDYKRLSKLALNSSRDLSFAFALSKDKKSIWIATNNPLSGEISINMKSSDKKVLGDAVEFNASGRLESKLILLDNFQFVKGSRFIDGVYNIEINTSEKLKLPFYYRFFSPKETEFKYVGESLISTLKKKDFYKLLKKYLKKKESNSKNFWLEIEQKYTTVISITEQIKDGVINVFSGGVKNWKNKVKNFEIEYGAKWGPFFTEFVKANDRSYALYASKVYEDSEHALASYAELSKIAESIGEESMIVLEQLEKFDTSQNDAVTMLENLKQESIKRFDSIVVKCNEELENLKSN